MNLEHFKVVSSITRGTGIHWAHNFNLQYAIILFTSVHRQTEERKYWVNNRNISVVGERLTGFHRPAGTCYTILSFEQETCCTLFRQKMFAFFLNGAKRQNGVNNNSRWRHSPRHKIIKDGRHALNLKIMKVALSDILKHRKSLLQKLGLFLSPFNKLW